MKHHLKQSETIFIQTYQLQKTLCISQESIQKLSCTVSQKKKKNRNTLIYFSTNYRTEMKLVPIIMDYCLLQFDALKLS